jgi:hypothetical protein
MAKISALSIYRPLIVAITSLFVLAVTTKNVGAKDNNTIDRQCQPSMYGSGDYRSNLYLQLGIDRWWGSIGRERSFPVHWTVMLDREDDYQLNIIIEHVNNWQLVPNATVRLGSRQLKFKQTPLRNYTVDLGCLKTGPHRLKIDAFQLPAKSIVEKVRFELVSRDRQKQLTTLFIADRPDVSREEYRLVGVNKPLTREALIDRFAPALYFSPQDSIRFPHNVELILDRKRVLENDNDRESTILGDSNTYVSDIGKPPYPKEVRAYAGILERKITDRRQSRTEIAISYYFFYPMSDWKKYGGRNTHEGDWEGVTVFLNQKGGGFYPDRMAFAQHIFKPKVIPWSQLEFINKSDRPKVFVGLGGHASYPHAGITKVAGIPEEHRGGSPPVFLHGKVEYLLRTDRANARHWLLYPGRWGHPDFNRQPDPLDNWDGDSAPRGPLFLDTKYSYKDSSGRGLRWLDPWQWSR